MNEPTTKKRRSEDEIEATIRNIAAIPDDEIDTSDIPEITDAQWKAAEKGRYFRPTKTSITIRLDADLVDWFKTQTESGGYQTEINRVLRRHMVETIKNAG